MEALGSPPELPFFVIETEQFAPEVNAPSHTPRLGARLLVFFGIEPDFDVDDCDL